VTATLDDPRDGAVYAALRLGHFGCKLHRSEDRGVSWTELPPPAYPAVEEGEGASLDMIWALATGGVDAPGTIWAGTLSGGVFVSSTGARAGRWSRACGSGPSGRNGSGAATIIRACTRSWSIRAMGDGSPSESLVAGCG